MLPFEGPPSSNWTKQLFVKPASRFSFLIKRKEPKVLDIYRHNCPRFYFIDSSHSKLQAIFLSLSYLPSVHKNVYLSSQSHLWVKRNKALHFITALFLVGSSKGSHAMHSRTSCINMLNGWIVPTTGNGTIILLDTRKFHRSPLC